MSGGQPGRWWGRLLYGARARPVESQVRPEAGVCGGGEGRGWCKGVQDRSLLQSGWGLRLRGIIGGMGVTLAAYLEVERLMMLLDDAGNHHRADILRNALDEVFWMLSNQEREFLNGRGRVYQSA